VVCFEDCGINAHRHCKDLVVMECRKHASCHGRVSIVNGQSRCRCRRCLVTFRVRSKRREMYSGHARLCVCLSVRRCMPTLLHGPGCKLGEWWGFPLVVKCWAGLQSVHAFRCYDSIARMRNVCDCLYSLYAWLFCVPVKTTQ